MSLVFKDVVDGKELGVHKTFLPEQTDHNFMGRVSLLDLEMGKHLLT